MSTRKVSVDAVREEMRILNSAADDSNEGGLLNWLTPDFWTMVGSAVTNLVAVAVLIGWVNSSQAEGLSQALTALVGATEVLVLNTALVWKYLSGRAELRTRVAEMKYQAAAQLAIERMRAK